MAAPYDEIRDLAISEVDAIYAETVLFRPMNGPAPDRERNQRDITGVLRTGDMEVSSVQGGIRQGKERMQIAGATALLALSVADYADLPVQERDSIQATHRPGQPWFKVLYIDRRSHSRIFVYLGDS